MCLQCFKWLSSEKQLTILYSDPTHSPHPQNSIPWHLFLLLCFYFGHTNNYNTLHLQFITINSNYRLLWHLTWYIPPLIFHLLKLSKSFKRPYAVLFCFFVVAFGNGSISTLNLSLKTLSIPCSLDWTHHKTRWVHVEYFKCCNRLDFISFIIGFKLVNSWSRFLNASRYNRPC